MIDATEARSVEARRFLLATLEAAHHPMSPAQLIALLRSHGVGANPGGVLLGMLADGSLSMGDDRLLRPAARSQVA